MSEGIIALIAISIVVFGTMGVITGIWYFTEFRPGRDREYRSATGGEFNVDVKYDPTIRKYYIELSRTAYGTVYRSHIMTRLKCIKYYKDKNIATVEAERFKGNF